MGGKIVGSHVIDRSAAVVFGFRRGGPPPPVGRDRLVVVVVVEVVLKVLVLEVLVLLLLRLSMVGRMMLTRRTSTVVDAVTRRRCAVQRLWADAVCRARGCSVLTPLDGVCIVPGTPSPQREVPLARHLILFLPLHPTVSVYRVHRAPVPRRFDGAQEFLQTTTTKTDALKKKKNKHASRDRMDCDFIYSVIRRTTYL